MANRLTRDTILLRALSLIDSPRLDEKDQPTSGTITSTALSIAWLQEGLDLAHNLFPQAGQLKTATFNIVGGTATYTISTIASDFILDFKDGVLLPSDGGRLRRKSVNRLLDVAIGTSSQGKPAWYGIHNGLLVLRPVPKDSYTSATLYYYALTTLLAAGSTPSFPTDLNLVEFVHLRGREWLREIPAGTAEKYMIDAVARLQKSGLGSEAEIDDVINLDRDIFPGGGSAMDDSNRGADWFTRVSA